MKTDKVHVPLADDVDIDYLAENYELCGREIKNAVKNACVSAALRKKDIVSQQDFIDASMKLVEERTRVNMAKDQTQIGEDSVPDGRKILLKEALQNKIDSKKIEVINSNNIE